MKILLTAFDPFGADALNASELVLRALPENIADVRIEKLVVPTVFDKSAAAAIAAIETHAPDAVVCLGQAGGRAAITPERVAINLRDAAIPDNEGHRPVDEPVVPGGPAAYFSTLPVRRMTAAALAAGAPAQISNTAGTFVCNSLMYALLHYARTHRPALRCGFIHVPYLVGQAAADAPSMALETVLAGVAAALGVLGEE